MDNMSLSDLIKTEEKERDLFVKAIVSCYHPKKVIVSGPGTGKTYLFGEILKQKAGHYLVLTFINNLRVPRTGRHSVELLRDCREIAFVG